MKVHRLIALTTLSTLCIAASAGVSADPVTFASSTPATATHDTLIHATRIAFPTQPSGPLDEIQALLNTMDSLPTLLFPSSTGPANKMVTSGGSRHSSMGFSTRDDRAGILSSAFAMDRPASLSEVRAEEVKAMAERPILPNAGAMVIVPTAPAERTSFIPGRAAPSMGRDASAAPILQTSEFTQANAPPPYSLERLYNQHRLFSDNPDVPFAEYDQGDHNPNDLSADAFQNNLFVPDRPFPMNQPLYDGNERDYTTTLEIAGGIAAIAFLSVHGHHRPVPEASSMLGLTALCAGGSLALMRGRRRASA